MGLSQGMPAEELASAGSKARIDNPTNTTNLAKGAAT